MHRTLVAGPFGQIAHHIKTRHEDKLRLTRLQYSIPNGVRNKKY